MRVTVTKAKSSQDQLLGYRERLSISQRLQNIHGVSPGAQLRVESLQTGIVGAYTIEEIHTDDEPAVRIPKAGREPLESTADFEAVVKTTVPRTDLSFDTAWKRDECVETVWHDPYEETPIVFITPHGGDGERNTDEAAVFAAKEYGVEDCSVWIVRNFGPNATDRLHITSSKISPVSYPGLQTVLGHGFDRAVSFHLWDGNEIIVGGLADVEVRSALAETIAEATNDVRDVVYEDGKYMGESPDNVVNKLTADGQSGIQIEAPAYIYQRYRKRLGEAVASFFL